jgi:hypothetical protein
MRAAGRHHPPMSTRTRGAGWAALAVIAAARVAPAVADTSQTSTVAQITIIEAGDKNYKAFHGAVWLEQDKASTNYRWGGAQCPGRDISDNTIQLMFAAFRSGDQVSLEYAVNDVKGKLYRCITAVTFSKT